MASVVHTQLLRVGNHTYRMRTQPIVGGRPLDEPQYAEEEAAWQEDEAGIDDAGELLDDSLISQEGDSYVTRISVDPEVLPHVIGKERRKHKELEQATGATLHIPRPGQHAAGSAQKQQQESGSLLGSSKSQTITIKAPSKQALSNARTQVELLISNAINSRMMDFTHFVSLPLSNEHTAAKLQDFQDKVLGQPGAQDKGFDRSIFINPKTLHLTLLMLKLYSDEARHRARQVLQGMAPQVQQLLAGKPLLLQLAGLDHMGDDPTDMHVLYLQVHEQGAGGRLAALCDLVVAKFKEAGLTVPGQLETVKLHATIINTRYRRNPAPGSGAAAAAAADAAIAGPQQGKSAGGRQQQQQQQWQQRVGFDGREMLKEWSGLDLGQYALPAVHLSQRRAYDSNTGYYACVESLSLKPE